MKTRAARAKEMLDIHSIEQDLKELFTETSSSTVSEAEESEKQNAEADCVVGITLLLNTRDEAAHQERTAHCYFFQPIVYPLPFLYA